MDIPIDNSDTAPPVAGIPHSDEAGTSKGTRATASAAADVVADAGTKKKCKKKKKKNKNKDLATDAGGGAFAPEPLPIKHDVLASNQDIETVMIQSDCSREDAVEALVRCNFVIEDAMCLASASLTPEDWIAWTDT